MNARILGSCAFGLLVGVSTPARADSYIDGMIFGVGVGVPVGLVATGGAVAGGLSVGDAGRPSTGAMTYAISAGSASVLWGSLLLYQGGRASGNKGLQLAPGAFDVAAGLTAIVLTLYRNAQPRTPTATTRVPPLCLPSVGIGVAGEPVPTLRLVWTG